MVQVTSFWSGSFHFERLKTLTISYKQTRSLTPAEIRIYMMSVPNSKHCLNFNFCSTYRQTHSSTKWTTLTAILHAQRQVFATRYQFIGFSTLFPIVHDVIMKCIFFHYIVYFLIVNDTNVCIQMNITRKGEGERERV